MVYRVHLSFVPGQQKSRGTAECWDHLRKYCLRTALDQDRDDVFPRAVLQLGIDRDGWNVGEPGVDLVATDDISIARVCDIRTFDVMVTPIDMRFGVVEKPTLPWATSWGLGWV